MANDLQSVSIVIEEPGADEQQQQPISPEIIVENAEMPEPDEGEGTIVITAGMEDEGDEGGDGDALSEVSDTGWDTDLENEEEKEKYDATGKKDYIRTCESIGIIPINHFIRCLTSHEATVDLSHHYLGSKGAKAIAVTLTTNTSITNFNISYNGLHAEGGLAIIDMFKENCYITHIDLSNNNIGPAGAFALCDALTNNNTITHCNISGNNLGDKAAEPIGDIIKSSVKISYLNLSNNEFSEPSGVILGSAIAESDLLQTLDLSWNHIRRKGAIAIAQGLKLNQMLKVLNLSYNGFGTEGAIALADALKANTVLTELDITDNRILVEGVKAIAKVIASCEVLETLKIGKNPMQLMGVIALLDSLKNGTSSVKTLELDGITVSIEIAKIIKDMEGDISGLVVRHGGIGGYREPKPIPTPLQKLNKYSKENNVKLNDLFLVFDKAKNGYLKEEEFRASLKHISAPLMEFEVQKLLKEFGSVKEPTPAGEEDGNEQQLEEESGPFVIIDYNAIISTSNNDNTTKQ